MLPVSAESTAERLTADNDFTVSYRFEPTEKDENGEDVEVSYETDNTKGSYFGYYYRSDSKPPEAANPISVNDGKLVIDASLSTDNRVTMTWVVNKNGVPFELEPGVAYKVTFQLRQIAPSPGPANRRTFVSLSNGICTSDLSAWVGVGASASVMNEPAEGVTYQYNKGEQHDKNKGAADNSAIFFYLLTNHVADSSSSSNNLPSTTTTYTKRFVAYDITNNGQNSDMKNYLAITFGLSNDQIIEIDNLTITYDSEKYTAVTYRDGSYSETVLAKIGSPLKTLSGGQYGQFLGWADTNGDILTTVPQADCPPYFGQKLTNA